MVETTLTELVACGVELPPTEDELPCDDGMPMETHRHVLQLQLLMDPLRLLWAERDDVFIGGNMFVYFSPEQVRTHDFRGPDFFVALGVPRRDRKSWVVWQEGKGPDVVIELLSDSTAAVDKGEKKEIYRDRLRVPEYIWYDPWSSEWAGFSLREGVYEPIEVDAQGRLPSRQLGLALRQWDGVYHGVAGHWLRWSTADGTILPTPQEVAAQEQQRATEAQKQASAAQQQVLEMRRLFEAMQQRVTALEAQLTRYQEQFGTLPE